jgi:aminoglycoside phosphotransferase (APT) family kinase protein
MTMGKMHLDEVDVDVSLVRSLLAAQFPQWADLTIEPIHSAGTDNAIFRLGDNLSVRLPRIQNATMQVDKEHQWLPKLAPFLPLAIPVPVAKGAPGEGYPWQWSVYQWIEGENANIQGIADQGQVAHDLAHFITALKRIDLMGGPPPGSHNSFRGEPLSMRDAETRAAIASLHGMLDADTATTTWEATLRAPEWDGPPVWFHGDLSPLNLLVERSQLRAVIDFGCLGVGDPACDLQVAWNLLSTQTRDIFRAELQIDDAMWARGRGWALLAGLIAIPYYQSTNPVLAGIARRAIDEVLADHNKERDDRSTTS